MRRKSRKKRFELESKARLTLILTLDFTLIPALNLTPTLGRRKKL
jgi:hypothetical protein